MNVFISHSSTDAMVAGEICDLIESKGKKCFIAPRDIAIGKEYAEEIMNGIDNSEVMVLLMSNAANRSPHVLREVERAVSKSIPVVVYKLEDVELSKSMEYFLMTHQWIDTKKKDDYSEIIDFIVRCDEKSQDFSCEEKPKGKGRNSLAMVAIVLLALLLPAVGMLFWVITREEEPKSVVNEVELGATVTFGSYQGEDISWRVLQISEDGSRAVLIAEHILTMKAYDAAEGGTYNSDGTADYWTEELSAEAELPLQIQVRGNSDWSRSNIRTWLNSADEVVQYTDQPPMAPAMSEHKNGYHNEAGFLNGFTEEELEAIVDTELTTRGNALAEDDRIETRDRVFLLSGEELGWFETAGMSILATPTQAAIENDGSGWYLNHTTEYGNGEYYWWLREPVEGTGSKCYLVSDGYTEQVLAEHNVGVEGFGIRPAITVSLEADIFAE